jgi:hypothetical protein
MPDNRRSQQESYNPYTGLAGAAGTLAAPAAAIWGLASGPTAQYPKQELSNKAKAKEAARIFSTLDPKVFKPDVFRKTDVVPYNQTSANISVFGRADPTLQNFLPELTWTYREPQAPSPELGSYAQQFNNTELPPNTIQTVTVTPAAAPSRFADKPIDNLVNTYAQAKDVVQYGNDELNRLLSIPRENKTPSDYYLLDNTSSVIRNAQEKLKEAKNALPTQGGYIWGNTEKAQYDYALGNTNEKVVITENPSLYVSRISANPSNEAAYLYTGDVKENPLVKPLQSSTAQPGPTWGIRGDRTRKTGDTHFRGDLIQTRGELTTGDIQALLKERNLPFEYAVKSPYAGMPSKASPTVDLLGLGLAADNNTLDTFHSNYEPNQALRANLSALAEREGLTPYQVIEKFARKVPALGPPNTPPTPGVIGGISISNPVWAMDKNSSYLDKADLTKAGLGTYEKSVAANKLVNSTVDKLLKTGEANKGLAAGGLSAGLLSTVLDPEVIDAASQGNYEQAIIKGGINSAIGAFTGKGIQSGLNLATKTGYLRPAAAVASALPLAGGVLGGLSLVGTGQALNRAYKARTGADWVTRNQPSARSYVGGPTATPAVQPRMGTAVLNSKPVKVPYGSVAGTRIVGRPWWDKLGSKATDFANLLNRGSVIGR